MRLALQSAYHGRISTFFNFVSESCWPKEILCFFFSCIVGSRWTLLIAQQLRTVCFKLYVCVGGRILLRASNDYPNTFCNIDIASLIGCICITFRMKCHKRCVLHVTNRVRNYYIGPSVMWWWISSFIFHLSLLFYFFSLFWANKKWPST